MKKLLSILSLVCIALCLMSASKCSDNQSPSDKVLGIAQEKAQQEANRQCGMPQTPNFKQKKDMKRIIELCDQADLVCYAYLVPELTGKPVFLGKCLGYGLPYATQYTNPEKPLNGDYNGEFTTIPQADPDGLFKPASADGTWIQLIDPKTNEARVVYCEPRVLISPFPLPNVPIN